MATCEVLYQGLSALEWNDNPSKLRAVARYIGVTGRQCGRPGQVGVEKRGSQNEKVDGGQRQKMEMERACAGDLAAGRWTCFAHV